MTQEKKENAQPIRKSFGLKGKIEPELHKSYHSPLVDQIKQEGYRYQKGRIRIFLAEEFGFCYGVDRAVDYAYETCAKFPDRRIFLTNEIIHNPRVNTKLKEMGVRFLSGPYAEGETLQDITSEDVVIIPAFGTSISELDELEKKGCTLVDTTCGSVMSVWRRVESYARDGFTSLIHGKFDHEETRATSSRAMRYPGGKFLVVRDMSETGEVCKFIEGCGNRDHFLGKFKEACSPGLDPEKDLGFIGCANQTTMLSSESIEIAKMLESSFLKRYGKEEAQRRFRHFDTVCSATQERQDAVLKLAREGLNLMIVVGGYNSSNTGHLVEISSQFAPVYHVKDASCIFSGKLIRHKAKESMDEQETKDWLPEGPVKIGITAGASTPNRVIEEVIKRILEIA
ncbi:MAG: 4-hydroxy-3-methylbut-2-enyl diphosphate reductase [Candidatus Omnitrophica bacterium]|nr:4-hydroxy-3-methylbut-2-enyl diphosphate reductase [Candidatus Omnitrophota bacterium]